MFVISVQNCFQTDIFLSYQFLFIFRIKITFICSVWLTLTLPHAGWLLNVGGVLIFCRYSWTNSISSLLPSPLPLFSYLHCVPAVYTGVLLFCQTATVEFIIFIIHYFITLKALINSLCLKSLHWVDCVLIAYEMNFTSWLIRFIILCKRKTENLSFSSRTNTLHK